LWLTPHWSARAGPNGAAEGLGFLIPALFFLAHWVFWRARGAKIRTRLALGAGAFMSAAFVTLEVTRAADAPDWIGALVSALCFAGAIAMNFAPGVTASSARRLYLQKNLHRQRRRQ
jgi:hypothetical protein